MSLQGQRRRKPSVYVAESDYERLSNLAESSTTRGGALLADELSRAVVIKDRKSRRVFVRPGSVVEFSDLTTGRTRRVQVVLPGEADIDRDRLSVLTPVGAALIGLTSGDTITISTEDGRSHVLAISDVRDSNEAA